MAEDTSLWILSHMLVTKQGSKLGFLELHHAISDVVQRLIGDLVPSLIPRQSKTIVQWKMQKPLQFSICEMLSETFPFGSSYVMGILCVLSHPYDYLHVWVHMAN